MGRSVIFVCKNCETVDIWEEGEINYFIEEHRGHQFYILHPWGDLKRLVRELRTLMGWEGEEPS